jgi:hypothetical protein
MSLKNSTIKYYSFITLPSLLGRGCGIGWLRRVFYADILAIGNIRNGAGYFEDAVVGSEKF